MMMMMTERRGIASHALVFHPPFLIGQPNPPFSSGRLPVCGGYGKLMSVGMTLWGQGRQTVTILIILSSYQ